MKKTLVLIIALVFVLTACGNKYESEIDEVTKKELESNKAADSPDVKVIKKENSNYYIYEDGNVIVMAYQSLIYEGGLTYVLYEKNQTSGEFEKDYNVNEEEYLKNNQPIYEVKNIK